MGENKDKKGNGFGLFMIGAAIGSVAALLFAPKSGKELRGDIKTKANDAKDKAMEKAEQAAEKTRDLTERARNTVKSKADQAANKADQAARQARNNVKR